MGWRCRGRIVSCDGASIYSQNSVDSAHGLPIIGYTCRFREGEVPGSSDDERLFATQHPFWKQGD